MDPIAFNFGSLSIRWYGVMLAAGFAAGLWTALRRARNANVSGELVSDVTLWLLLGAIAGARAVYVITYWDQEFAGHPFSEVFMVQHGGLVYYGGLIGATLAGIVYLKWKKLDVWKMADVLAPSIALGSVFGRTGCLLNGCCYGRECDLPWAVIYPEGYAAGGALLHPVQIYDALLNLVLFVALSLLFKRRKFDGQIFALYLMAYAVCRSMAEHFRGDYPADHIHHGLTSAQVVSMGIFIAGALLYAWRSRQTRVPPKTPLL